MKIRYLRLVRRTYRYLRHPHIKRITWLEPIIKSIFYRRYWRPCRTTVANGLSIGLFCAMLPIPMQMLLAAVACLRLRGNVPIAVAACWLTNPITQIPTMILQERFGAWLHFQANIPRPPFIGHLEHTFQTPNFSLFGWQILTQGSATANVGNFVIGFLAAAILLAILAYPLVYIIHFCIPHRHRHPAPPSKDDFEI